VGILVFEGTLDCGEDESPSILINTPNLTIALYMAYFIKRGIGTKYGEPKD